LKSLKVVTNNKDFYKLNLLEHALNNFKIVNELEYDCIKSLGNSESLFLAYTFGNKFIEEKAYDGYLFEPIDEKFDKLLSPSFIRFKVALAEFDKCLKSALSFQTDKDGITNRVIPEIYEFLRLLIKICTSSGAYANLNVIIEFPKIISSKKLETETEIPKYYFKFFIPPITVIVDQQIRDLNIYIQWNESSFSFMEINGTENSVMDTEFVVSSYSYERIKTINNKSPPTRSKSMNNEEIFESKIARKFFRYFVDNKKPIIKNKLLKGKNYSPSYNY
jgi:hypothetical protein